MCLSYVSVVCVCESHPSSSGRYMRTSPLAYRPEEGSRALVGLRFPGNDLPTLLLLRSSRGGKESQGVGGRSLKLSIDLPADFNGCMEMSFKLISYARYGFFDMSLDLLPEYAWAEVDCAPPRTFLRTTPYVSS